MSAKVTKSVHSLNGRPLDTGDDKELNACITILSTRMNDIVRLKIRLIIEINLIVQYRSRRVASDIFQVHFNLGVDRKYPITVITSRIV
jgi:hypothetical protein